MKQELPNLVDERRFRRREPEAVERDEFGRVSFAIVVVSFADKTSANGQKRRSPSTSNPFQDSTCVLKWLDMAALM